jgi:hypothetical protein
MGANTLADQHRYGSRKWDGPFPGGMIMGHLDAAFDDGVHNLRGVQGAKLAQRLGIQ